MGDREAVNGEEDGRLRSFESGIDLLYLVQSEEMDLILPWKQWHGSEWILTCESKYFSRLDSFHSHFSRQWSQPTDIYSMFRTLNQWYIQHKLSERRSRGSEPIWSASPEFINYIRGRLAEWSRNYVTMTARSMIISICLTPRSSSSLILRNGFCSSWSIMSWCLSISMMLKEMYAVNWMCCGMNW